MTLSNDSTSQVAVITGGSKGIGYNVAAALVARGIKVVIGDINDKDGEIAVKELNKRSKETVAIFIHVDVTKYKDVLALFALAEKEFGGIDIVVANAGMIKSPNGYAPFDALDESEMKVFDVNVGGVIKCNKTAIMYMSKRTRPGVIINTASGAGIYPTPGMCDYAASKHAIVGWTRSLSRLPDQCNIRVNAVCPTWVDTDFINNPSIPKEIHDFIEANPKANMDDVVKAYLQCIDDQSLSGATLTVLADGIHLAEPPTYPNSMFSPELIQNRTSLMQGIVDFYKRQFDLALQRFSKLNSNDN